MKKIFKGLLLSFLLISSASLTSCFGFGEEALQIDTITTVTLENGDIQVIITYTDEDVKPTTFVVPKGTAGEDGKDGNGIKEISSTKSDNGLDTLVTVFFTNDKSETFTVPNGVSIKNIEKRFDEEEQCTYIKFIFTDDTESEEYALPKGEKGDKGEDGNGIVSIDQILNDDLSLTLIIYLTVGDPVIVNIPAPQKGEDGEDGKEISNIESVFNEEKDAYEFKVTYTDETETVFEVARQNKWFTEDKKPTNSDGKNGDIWYDVTNQIIYIKENNSWKEAINFEILKPEEYTVRFELNDSKSEPAEFKTTKLNYIEYTEIEKGNYLSTEGYQIPIPERDGYQFVGWYTVRTDYNPTNGMFTDLTPVMSDLTLYARWEKVDVENENN